MLRTSFDHERDLFMCIGNLQLSIPLDFTNLRWESSRDTFDNLILGIDKRIVCGMLN